MYFKNAATQILTPYQEANRYIANAKTTLK